MTPQEFKAWFEGFTEALEEVPTEDQWKRIKERVAEIDGKPVTEHHWYAHYYPICSPIYYYPIYNPNLTGCNPVPAHTVWTTTCGAMPNSGIGQNYQGTIDTTCGAQGSTIQGYQQSGLGSINTQFSSLTAMNALGRAEAATLTS